MNREAKTIGAYRLLRFLGRGGMSEVYEVENLRIGSRFALKLFAYNQDDQDVRRRFEVEGRLLAKLHHPRIVRVVDIGRDEETGRPYFVMDLVLDDQGRCRSLADVQPGTVDEEEIGRWYDDIRCALNYIHAEGVIHRDLKLQNVLIGADGHAVLMDFGVSKIVESAKEGRKIVDTVQTLVKMKEGRSLVMGSVGYMAPEVEMGAEATPASDWYALGVIIYRLLTGSWCDSRTDIVATLDSYHPVWRRILPKLLHSNPQGRECLSYAEGRERDLERAEVELENRVTDAEEYLLKYRRWFWSIGVASCVLIVTLGICCMRACHDREIAREILDRPAFSDIFSIPDVSTNVDEGACPTVEQFQVAMIDALALTQDVFIDLRGGAISRAKARTEIVRMWELAKKADYRLYSRLPEGYQPSEEYEALTVLFRNAARLMQK